MGNLGSRPPPEVPAAKINKNTITLTDKDQTVLDLKLVAGEIKKHQRNLSKSCDELLQRAKTLMLDSSMNEQRALGLMKLRKYKLEQSTKLDNQLNTVFKLIDEVEWAEINKEVFTNLKSGTRALKAMNDAMPLEEVERILEGAQDAVDMERQISALIGACDLGDADQAELEKELASLQSSDVASTIAPSRLDALPSVPTNLVLPRPIDKDRPIHITNNESRESNFLNT